MVGVERLPFAIIEKSLLGIHNPFSFAVGLAESVGTEIAGKEPSLFFPEFRLSCHWNFSSSIMKSKQAAGVSTFAEIYKGCHLNLLSRPVSQKGVLLFSSATFCSVAF